MVAVPLGRGAYKRDDGLVPEVQCLNMFIEQDLSGLSPDGFLRIQRPGTEVIQTLDEPYVRAFAIDPSDSAQYAVAGSDLYRDGVSVGTMYYLEQQESGPPIAYPYTDGMSRIVILTGRVAAMGSKTNPRSPNVFLWDGATFAELVLPDDAPPGIVDIEQLNGYLIILCANGRFYWLAPEETAIDPLNFATAESFNDGANAVRQVGSEFWIFGTRSIEPWQATGDFTLPFQPATGRVIPHGCLDGLTAQRFDNTIVWVGDDANVYRGGGVAEVISTSGISERIRKRDLLSYMSAWTFSVDGHTFYLLRIPNQGTFAYDAATREWSKWASAGSTQFLPWVGDSFGGEVFAGLSSAGSVVRVNPIQSGDNAVPFLRVITATVPVMGRPPRNDSLSVGVGASADTICRIRYRDGQEDYPEDYYDELEVRAPFDVVSMYRLGQPQQPYREIEVSFTGIERVRVAGCTANSSWQ